MRSSTNNKNDMLTTSRKLIMLAVCGLFFIACSLGFANKTKPKVYIKKLKSGHFQMMVENRPYVVKGVCYNPIPIGKSHEYDWWSDPNKPWIADGKLMKEMGVNTVRIYQVGTDPLAVKKVIADLYNLYGIRVILGDWLGFWNYPCPLYGDKDFRDGVKKQVLEMVSLYKEEPGVLFWALGNENNYSSSGLVNPWSSPEIDKEPDPQKQKILRFETYYAFVNELAKEIKKIDNNHPVALGNGELIGLEVADKITPDIDLLSCIIYRGKTFGSLFKSLKATYNKPIVLSEIGADCYDSFLNKEDQNMQAFFLESQWKQIYQNLAGVKDGEGNCLGGVVFEWTDEYWKHNKDDPEAWKVHDTEPSWSSGSYYFDIQASKNMNMNEEWFGIVALSDEFEAGINKRVPRKAYYVVREFWKNPVLKNQPVKSKK